MRIATAFVCALFALALVACDDDHEGYQTLQACYDDHHNNENLTVQEAIIVCCLDHPIVGVNPSCKDTQPDCVVHVDAELDGSVTAPDIQAACTEYINQKN